MKNQHFLSKLIFIAFWFYTSLTNSLFGQITFEPTFINQCSNEILHPLHWTISDSLKTYGFRNLSLKKKSLALPKLGKYKLHVGFNELEINLTINKNGVNRDTFFLKRITHSIYISNPPHSEYLDCDSLANGKVTDFFYNGNPRIKGSFKNGQIIDTLFSYFRSGQPRAIFIRKKKNWKKTIYFKNGNIKSIFNTKKRFEKEFYSYGQLKLETEWSKKYKIKLKEYFPNGNLKKKQTHKTLEIYNQNKIIIEKMKRKEILIFERLFAKKKHGKEKFYKYTWESFDGRGILKRKIIFDNDYFQMSPFPDSIQQIDDFLFEEIIFYFNGKEFKKVALELQTKKNFSRVLVIYRKEEKKWVREKTTSINKVHEMIENYSN